jgi:hypothetical protein
MSCLVCFIRAITRLEGGHYVTGGGNNRGCIIGSANQIIAGCHRVVTRPHPESLTEKES